MKKHTIIINQEKCIGCEMCVNDCFLHNIKMVENKATVISEQCIKCGHCAAICPEEAVSISGLEEDIVKNTYNEKVDPEKIINMLKFKRSMRNFKKGDIPDHIVEQIIEAGRLTPTARNMQDVSYIVLKKDKDKFEGMAISYFRKLQSMDNEFSKGIKSIKVNDNFFFFGAPVVILVVSTRQDNGYLAAANMTMVADANGLGTLYSGFFCNVANGSKEIRQALDIPEGYKVSATLVLGYPGVEYKRSAPKNPAKITYM